MKTTAAILLLTAISFAQAVRVPTVARTVQLFGELERRLETVEPSTKAQFLTDDFEERLCAEPGTPVPRADWLHESAAKEAAFSQEGVHIYGDLAVYSGLRTRGAKAETIVDTWKHADSVWKLAVRYRCPSSGPKPAESRPSKRY